MEVLLVGLGNMGLKYLRKLEEIGISIRISDIDEGKAEGLPYPFIYNIEDIPDTVTHAIVAIDPKDHVKVSSLLLDRGIKVLLEKPPALIKSIESKRLNRGVGYFSPLWDLAWHDLYIMDFLIGNIKIEEGEGKGYFRRLKGFAGSVPFRLEVAWKYEDGVERSMILGNYRIDFTNGTVYEGDKKLCENKKDKLKLMVTLETYCLIF